MSGQRRVHVEASKTLPLQILDILPGSGKGVVAMESWVQIWKVEKKVWGERKESYDKIYISKDSNMPT